MLDLELDARATVLDALCVESMLEAAGIDTVFYPWHPADDVFTPLGAIRPWKLFVRSVDFDEVADVAEHVLEGNPMRREILVPVDDAWILRRWISVIIGDLRQRADERGGSWATAWLVFKGYVALSFGLAILAALFSMVSAALRFLL